MSVQLFSNIDDSVISNLPADNVLENYIRQVKGAAYSYVVPKPPSNPKLIAVATDFAEEIGLMNNDWNRKEFLQIFSGAAIHRNTKPYAMCYGGHQFGQWAGQLGDGRAINLFEVMNNGKRWALQLKGAGLTPYSRNADGLAVLRSSIREFLCSEAMFHLGVPTTRALSLVTTGDQVLRDMMYDGNSEFEKGAIVCRVSPTFIRFGNFQIFAARRDNDNLQKFTDYTIRYFFPDLGKPSKQTYIEFFKRVTLKTLDLIIHWQRVGFVHGVMNTDNMSILGLTIDYGPYGWLEDYDSDWTPNTTDRQTRRYRFGQQPQIALWNLVQLANALYPLVEEQDPFVEIMELYKNEYSRKYQEMMCSKIGLQASSKTNTELIQRITEVLQLLETDMTIFFRNLANFSKEEYDDIQAFSVIEDAFYRPEELSGDKRMQWLTWIQDYLAALQKDPKSDIERRKEMNSVNPKYVLRNYMSQLAIDDADQGNYELIEELQSMLKDPYQDQPQYDKWFTKRPDWARHKVGCSMLSCSS